MHCDDKAVSCSNVFSFILVLYKHSLHDARWGSFESYRTLQCFEKHLQLNNGSTDITDRASRYEGETLLMPTAL
jgi:hypothetical protein